MCMCVGGRRRDGVEFGEWCYDGIGCCVMRCNVSNVV
jgi:hypothetical protein